MPMSTWTVTEVCDILGRLEGVNMRNVAKYKSALEENNITGLVLMHCDLQELKPILPMGFGDWELFRAMVEFFRDKEMASITDPRSFRTRHPSGGRILEEDASSATNLKTFTSEKPNQNLEVSYRAVMHMDITTSVIRQIYCGFAVSYKGLVS